MPRVSMTRSVSVWVGDDSMKRDFVNECLHEHFEDPEHGVGTDDGLANLAALSDRLNGYGGRVLTTHIYSPQVRLWVITEWGDGPSEPLTTVLFPEDY